MNRVTYHICLRKLHEIPSAQLNQTLYSSLHDNWVEPGVRGYVSSPWEDSAQGQNFIAGLK